MINQNVSDQKYQFMTDLKSKLSKLSDDELTKIEVEISSAYRGMGKKNYDLFRKAYGETSVGQACMDMMIEIRVERSIMSIRH